MIHFPRSCGAALLVAAAASLLGIGCDGGDGGGSSDIANGGDNASAGETSSGGSGNASRGGSGNASSGGSDTGAAGTVSVAGGRKSCDADGDERRSLDCGGDDCDDDSEDVSPEMPTDLNQSSSPPYEEGEHSVFQVARGKADELLVLYRLGAGELRLATWSGGEWTTEAVGSTAVQPYEGAAMHVDAEGKIHVALLSIVQGSDPVTRDLYYATNASGTWQEEQVTDSTATDPSALHPRIALDGDGYVHMAFQGQGVQHVTNASGAWVVTKIGMGGSGALATAADGTVHAVIASGFSLFHGPFAAEGFELAGPVEKSGSGDLVAAFDAGGRLHVAAVGLDDESDRVLKYTIIDGTAVTAVDTGVANPAIPRVVLGAQGEVHVFSDVKLETGHLVGTVHGFYGDAGFELRGVHSTPSYVQEDFGFASIDDSGRLHRITPDFGQHTYSDDVDNNCDGTLW